MLARSWLCGVLILAVELRVIEATEERQEGRKPRREKSKSSSRLGSRRPLWHDKCPVQIVFIVSELARYQTIHIYKSTVDISKEYTLRGVFAKAIEQIEEEHKVDMRDFTAPNPIAARMESNDGTVRDLIDLRSNTDTLRRLCRHQANLTFMFRTSFYLAEVDINVKTASGRMNENTYTVNLDQESTMTVGELADAFAAQAAPLAAANLPQGITLRTRAGFPDIYESAVKVISANPYFLPVDLENNANLKMGTNLVLMPVEVDVQLHNYVRTERTPRAICVLRVRAGKYYGLSEIAKNCLCFFATKRLLDHSPQDYSYDDVYAHYRSPTGSMHNFTEAVITRMWSQGCRLQMRFAKSAIAYCDGIFVRRLGVFPGMKLFSIYRSVSDIIDRIGKELKKDQIKLFKSKPGKFSYAEKTYRDLNPEIYNDLIGLPEVHIAFYSL